MIFKPHKAIIQQVTEAIDGTTKSVYVPTYPIISNNTPCHIYPLSQQASFEKYAVDMKRPHEMLMELKYQTFVEPGNWVKKGNRVFVMKSPPQIFDGGGPVKAADHCSVLLEEMQYAE